MNHSLQKCSMLKKSFLVKFDTKARVQKDKWATITTKRDENQQVPSV